MPTKSEHERKRAWKAANPERVKAMKRRHYEKHKAQIIAKASAWYEANRDRHLQQKREQYALNREEIPAAERARYANDPRWRQSLATDKQRRRAENPERAHVLDKKHQETYREKDPVRCRMKRHRAAMTHRA